MSNFEKPKTAKEDLEYAMNMLEDSLFKFVCFEDSFKRYLQKAGILKEET